MFGHQKNRKKTIRTPKTRGYNVPRVILNAEKNNNFLQYYDRGLPHEKPLGFYRKTIYYLTDIDGMYIIIYFLNGSFFVVKIFGK